MKVQTPTFDQTPFEAETARFRAVLAKGRSANQLALFDFLVERADDDRPPKEIEIAFALFGEGAIQDPSGDSGARVYVHRLRKRMESHYAGRRGPRLTIPSGEYRIVLAGSGSSARARYTLQRLASAVTGHPELSMGLSLILIAMLVLGGRMVVTPQEAPSPAQTRPNQVLPAVLANLPSTLIVVGDSMLIAESEDQRSVQRMILDPQIRTRDELGQFLRDHPEAFYRLYDFDLNFAPIASIEAAWKVQDDFGKATDGNGADTRILPASALTPEILRSRDLLFVGRLSQLGTLEARALAMSRFKLTAFDRLTDRSTGRTYVGQVYSGNSGGPDLDHGYLGVTRGPEGRSLVVLAGLGDLGTAAMADLMSEPSDLATLEARLGQAKRFEALYEIRAREGLGIERRLVLLHPLP